MPTVLITGGTGLIGKNLTSHLTDKGYDIIILTRKLKGKQKEKNISYALWDIKKQEIDKDAISNADFIIHLAGAGVMDKRWTSKYKKAIVESRTESSRLIVKALKENKNKVKAVISASAIGWYGKDSAEDSHYWNGFTENDEPDKNFLGETCRLWEESIEPVTESGIRLVKLRQGIVLSNEGGAFVEFKKPIKFGIAGILGNGKQIVSWIHIDDVSRMYLFAMEKENLSGSYNAVSPLPITNKQLVLETAEQMRKSFYIPVFVPNFLLKLFLGEKSIEVLKSCTVSCEKIKKEGFNFLYPSFNSALNKLARNFK